MSEIIYPSITSVMSISGSLSSVQNLLVISAEATHKLRNIIGWNRFDYPPNRIEMGGWLIGRYIRDDNGHIIQAEVTDILKAECCEGTPTYLEWPAIEDIRLQREFFRIKEDLTLTHPDAGEALTRIGWWHTHPNSLPVFMSSTDMSTQRLKFFKPHDYSVVLNPHRMTWKAFIGKDAVEVPAIMLIDSYIPKAKKKNTTKAKHKSAWNKRKKKKRLNKEKKRKLRR